MVSIIIVDFSFNYKKVNLDIGESCLIVKIQLTYPEIPFSVVFLIEAITMAVRNALV